jgi:ABC-2 type transport system permease protein
VRYAVYGILAVLVALSITRRVRRARRARGDATAPSAPVPAAHERSSSFLHGRTPLGNVGLVAAREIRERLRGRIFRVVTILLMLVIAGAIIIPSIHHSKAAVVSVGVVSGPTAPSASLITQVAHSLSIKVRVVDEGSRATAISALRAGRVDLVVNGADGLIVKEHLSASDTSDTAQLAHTLAQDLAVYGAYRADGLSLAQIEGLAHVAPVPVTSLVRAAPSPPVKTGVVATSLIGVILIFVILNQYLTWTLMGVLEEKASRVVEVLLATVRPIELLGGKLLGIGTVVMAQAFLLVIEALVIAKAVGSSLLHGSGPAVIVTTLVFLALGYALYSWLYAAAGSMAERQDQVQSLILPLTVPLIFGYIVVLTGVSSGSPSALVKVLAYVPPTAPFAMTALVGFGDAAWWQVALSAGESVVLTIGVAVVAARIYRRAVLRTGRRVRWSEVLATGTGADARSA